MSQSNTSRIELIDSLRGFSLAGVALVHFSFQFMNVSPPEGFMEGVNSLVDNILVAFVNIFLMGKFFSIFSLLFGLSYAIQMQSAEKRGSNFSMRFLWRAILLFTIGYAHHLFYGGDILTIYALLTPFLIPFYRLKNKWLLIVAGICFIGLPRFITFYIMGNTNFFGLPNAGDITNELNITATNAVFSGSLSDVFSVNSIFGMKSKFNYQLQVFGRLYYTFGYFLIGLWLGKIMLFKQLNIYKKSIKRTLKWSAALLPLAIIICVVSFYLSPQPTDFSHILHVCGINFYDLSSLLLTSIIICSFILLYQKSKWQKRLSYFSVYGRMALTNYILQGLIGTFILYNWGLGFIGQLRTSYLIAIAILLIIIQRLFSLIWLKRFNNGPLEWLWRCGTFLKWQPFLRKQGKELQAIKIPVK